MSAIDDAIAALSAETLPPAGAAAWTTMAEPTGIDNALSILGKSPDELKAQTAAPQTPGIGQRVGSFATGVNDALTSAIGVPVDFATALLKQLSGLQGGLNAALPPSMQRYATQPASEITRPVGGPESMRGLLEAAVGRTEPKDEFDRLLHGAGAGVGATLGGMGVGGALSAAGRAPMMANALLGGGNTLPVAFGNLATGAGAGTGAVAGEDIIAALGGGDAAQAVGGVVGGLGGGLATALAPALAVNAVRGGSAAARPFSQSGREGIAGRILNESAAYGEPSLSPAPLGIRPTLGQASNDPGLLALERVVQQASPAIQGEMATQASANNQLIRGGLGQIGQPAGREPYQISQQAAAGLEANRATMRQGERAAWEAIDPTNSVMVPMQPIRDRMQGYVDSLTRARRTLVPDDVMTMIMGGDETQAMREVQDIRSFLTGKERMARKSSDFNTANVLREMDETLFQRLPEGAAPLPANADQVATLRYQTALDQSRAYNETFNAKPIRDVFRVEGTPDSAVFDKMLAPGQGQSERVGQYLKATLGQPELAQHGRDWFTARLSNVIGGARQDAEGDAFVLGNKLSQFVTQNRPLIDSGLFTAEQRKVIDNLVEAATMVERTGRAGPVGGSDTAAKLAGKDYVSAMVGNWFKPVAAAEIAGAGIGAGMFGGAGGAAAGALATGRAVSPLVERAYAGAAEKVMTLLSEAMRDPTFAKELMRKASPANTLFASPKLKNFLATAPLTIESASP